MTRLTHLEARERAALLHVTSCAVELALDQGDEIFGSSTTLEFTSSVPGATTFLELRPHTLHSAELNGRRLDVTTLSGGRLPLPDLRAENTVTVVADMAYSRDGQGIHRYVDPADGETYLYAHTAVDATSRVFACFDQPDLKIPLSLRVSVDESWQVIGTGPAERLDANRWQLATTPPQSTYLTTLAAGPYVSYLAEHHGLPIGLHCRASLADALKREQAELFEITTQCLDAYQRLFGVQYPYAKYDQVFVPEFGVLAMENPACVLIRDTFVFESAPTESDREDRAVVIAHEMAHMWFGNLVTMRWWDDLWLNESFADHMGHRLVTEATRFTGARTSFAAGRKGQGYAADQRTTTHPVVSPAPDLDAAELAFDRISYFKGSAVLGQLAARLGDTALLDGLRIYFERHAHANATTDDFLAALSLAGGEDLTEWAQAWLHSAQVNTLTPVLTTRDGRIVSAEILQSAPESHPVLRPHTLEVGLYGADEPYRIRVDISGERTALPGLTGRPVPELLLLNDGDLAYAKVRYDATATEALAAQLPRLSPLNRAMVWGSLLLSVQDGDLPARDYLRLATGLVTTERQVPILSEVLRQARTEIADRYLEPGLRDGALAGLAGSCRTLLTGPGPANGSRLLVLRTLIDSVTDTSELLGWLNGALLPGAVAAGEPDGDLGWRIRHRLAVLGALDEAEIDAAERARPGSQSAGWAATCRAARPSVAGKAAAWEAITTDRSLSHHDVGALAAGFWQPEQSTLTAPYVRRFFIELQSACAGREQLAPALLRDLYPRYAATADTLRLAGGLLERPDLGALLRRPLSDLTDDLRRVVAARGLEKR
ncbi:aminopeptidase N [Streptomyces sp. NPDC051664]|uniref:aminopeptidase N n=1 Tax=Streptomyces sp. NPDC051664 TaxID=3365668 RepID=UPI00379DAA9C